MRHAAILLLALAALVVAPAARAWSASAAPDAAAADAPGLVPAADASPVQALGDLASAAGVTAAAGGAASGAIALELPGASIQAEVATSASAGASPAAADGSPSAEAAPSSRVSPSSVEPAVVAAAATPLAVAAVGIASGLGARALAGGAGTWGARAVRALLAFASFGLFSRIERGDLLANAGRAQVHDVVAQEPGLTGTDVQARTGAARGTTLHHLRRLESHGLLVSLPQGGQRRYFIANTPAATLRSEVATLLQPTARRIATLVAVQPGIDQTALCQALGLNGPSASKHLGRFREHGLVASRRVGRRTVHHPTQGLLAALGVLAPTPMVWGRPAASADASSHLLVAAP